MRMDYQAHRTALGIAITRERKRQALTQLKLANMTGINTGYLCNIESGKANASINVIFAIADALDVSPAHLFEAAESLRNNSK